ncbi:MAG: metal-dependent hydrolase [Nanoarchaeota archaeon]
MRGHTHLAFGVLIGILFLKLKAAPSLLDAVFLFLFAALGSLLPDIDYAGSILGKRVKVIGAISEHRGLFHSLWFVFLFSLLCYLVIPAYWLIFSVSYLSHLALDACNHSGIQLFYPVGKRIRGRVKSGGFLDTVLFLGLAVVDVVLLVPGIT